VDQVSLTVDGISVSVPVGSTILAAAEQAGVRIPTLCHHPDQKVKAVCRVCVVEVKGQRVLQPACAYPVSTGMAVSTNTQAVREARRTIVELMLAHHPTECLTCSRNLNCELQRLAEQYGVTDVPFDRISREFHPDDSTAGLVRDPNKCVNCRRCVEVCHEVQRVSLLYPMNRGCDTVVLPPGGKSLMNLPCVMCGQCLLACPTGAISEKDDTERVWAALHDPAKHVVVQTAPAVRVAIGETAGLGPGAVLTGQMVAGLKRLGFDRVFDTDFTADLTVIEEGNELLERMRLGGALPMITSCSPGWIKFAEHFYPSLLPNLSTCKSPQQMFGALTKTYYAEQTHISADRIFSVSIMPCTAKKYEAARPEMNSSGFQDVDAVLTTRELGRMLKQAGIDLAGLPEEKYDDPFGLSTGAGVIFGASGGVMEAALRTVYATVTGEALGKIDFRAVRRMPGVREARVQMGTNAISVAVASGLDSASRLMDAVVKAEAPYQFIEVMCCPGGCVGGGGQPIPATNAVRKARAAALHRADRASALRTAHENPAVIRLYADYLGHPLSKKAHRLLHTTYKARPV
jgi:NADH-quinone oxidoreductase subunit G/NADP-reducing hydrogenase subunit HndD